MSTTRPDVPAPDVSVATVGLAVGDVALIGAFVVLGEVRHYPLDVATARTPGTLVPFLVGWLVASLVAGLYAAPTRTDVRRAAGRTAGGWIGATVVAMALRATPVFHGDADATFALVALLAGFALLVPWRVGVAYAHST